MWLTAMYEYLYLYQVRVETQADSIADGQQTVAAGGVSVGDV